MNEREASTIRLSPVVLQDGTRTYVYGLDLISATDGSGNQSYFSYNAVGSVSDLTNGAGTVTDTYVYDVFGAITSHSGPSTNYWLFTGEQLDGATGDTSYYFVRAATMTPETGATNAEARPARTATSPGRSGHLPGCGHDHLESAPPVDRRRVLWLPSDPIRP